MGSANQSLETQSRDDSLAGQAHERANARIVDGYLIGLSALALPALAASLYRVVEVGWLPIMGLHTALAVGVFGVTAARRRLPYLFRALFVVAIGMAIAVGALMTSGLRAQPLMFFSATLVTAFLLLGLRWGIATTAVAIGTYVATYFLVAWGFLVFPLDSAAAPSLATSWVVQGLAAAVVTAALICGIMMMKREMWEALGRAEAQIRTEQELGEAREHAVALEAAKSEAERESIAKSKFLATMSHELRTPMNAVIGMASVLVDTPLNAEQRRQVQTIRDSGHHLLALLNDVLDFSKIEAGHITVESVPFAPGSLTNDAVGLVAGTAASNGLALTTDIAVDLPRAVLGDPARVRQILLNLLGNAIKFTERGGVRVSVGNSVAVDGRVAIEWTVADTGIGVPTEAIPSLFQEFTQGDSSISRRFGGTGLGLAICKRLADLIGATIALESELGRGTTVRVLLPVQLSDRRPITPALAPMVPIELLKRRLARRSTRARLLIAEDNPANQLVTSAMLAELPIEVVVVDDGAKAVEKATEAAFDLILMDVQMPVLDGLAAMRQIRSSGGPNARAPLVGFTANAFPEDIAACFAAGAVDVLTKPVEKHRLLACVAKYVVNEGAAAPVPPASPPAAQATTPALDAGAIVALSDDLGEDGARKALRTFVKHTTEQLNAMPGLLADGARLRVEVHSIKGAARLVGATRLASDAAALERRIVEGGSVQDADIAQLREAFDDFQAAMRRDPRLAELARTAA